MSPTATTSTTCDNDCDHQDIIRINNKKRRRLQVAGAVAGTSVIGICALTWPFVGPALRAAAAGGGLGRNNSKNKSSSTLWPYMATPRNKVHDAFKFIIAKNNNKSRQNKNTPTTTTTFLDLGSGDGETVYQALKVGYQKAIGIENNFTLYAFSQIRRQFFWTYDERKRSQFLYKDIFKFDNTISNKNNNNAADDDSINNTTIMVFGVQPLMERLSHKLAKECTNGTHVLSYRFELPTIAQQSTEESITTTTTSENNNKDGDGNNNDDDDNLLLLRADLVYDQDEMRIYECRNTTRATTGGGGGNLK